MTTPETFALNYVLSQWKTTECCDWHIYLVFVHNIMKTDELLLLFHNSDGTSDNLVAVCRLNLEHISI
jgi:hypothetical protein